MKMIEDDYEMMAMIMMINDDYDGDLARDLKITFHCANYQRRSEYYLRDSRVSEAQHKHHHRHHLLIIVRLQCSIPLILPTVSRAMQETIQLVFFCLEPDWK